MINGPSNSIKSFKIFNQILETKKPLIAERLEECIVVKRHIIQDGM
jgi:hypothetical protein